MTATYTPLDLVNAVWQSRLDDELRTMTANDFYATAWEWDMSDEDAQEAWELFKERRTEVFG